MEGRYLLSGKDGKTYRPEKFIAPPICNDHPGGYYVSNKFWIALVSMFGVVTEKGGVTSYDPQSVQPEMVNKNIIEFRDFSEESWNGIRNTMAYITGYNNFTWPMTLEESYEEDGKTLFIDMSGINQDKDDQIGTDES
jgi:hypothetical protein